MKTLTLILAALVMVLTAVYGETIPQKPDRYFNDNVGLVTQEQALQFNERLAQFERDTSNQFVVAIYPYMDTDSDPADYTQRIAQSWGVGQKDKNNGVILFIFMKMANGHGHIRIVPGYGLEGAIPDALAKEITSQMAPYFKSKRYMEGIQVGVASIITASKQEYKGAGETVAEQGGNFSATTVWVIVILGILGIIIAAIYSIFHFMNEKTERELREKEEEMERVRNLDSLRESMRPEFNSRKIVTAPKSKHGYSGIKTTKTGYCGYTTIPVPIPIPISRKDDDDDDDDRHSSSSSSSSSDDSSSSSFSSFDSGGGSFGGAGAGSDF